MPARQDLFGSKRSPFLQDRRPGRLALQNLAALIAHVPPGLAGVADVATEPALPSSIDDVTATVICAFTDTCVPTAPVPSAVDGSITIATTNSSPTCSAVATPCALPPQEPGWLGAG